MKYFKFSLAVSLCILVFVSCTKTEIRDNNQRTISFLTSFPGETKVSGGFFQEGDAISVFATQGSGVVNSSNYADNVKHLFSGGKFVAVDKGIVYPDSYGLYFKAVYPYVSNASAKFTFVVSSDQSTYESFETSDLMISTTGLSTEDEPLLSFKHKMAWVSLEPVLSSDSEKCVIEMVNVSPYAEVDLNSNKVTALSGYSYTIKGYQTNDGVVHFYIPPQSIPAKQVLFKIKVGNTTINCSSGQTQNLHGGRNSSYIIDLSSYGTKSGDVSELELLATTHVPQP